MIFLFHIWISFIDLFFKDIKCHGLINPLHKTQSHTETFSVIRGFVNWLMRNWRFDMVSRSRSVIGNTHVTWLAIRSMGACHKCWEAWHTCRFCLWLTGSGTNHTIAHPSQPNSQSIKVELTHLHFMGFSERIAMKGPNCDEKSKSRRKVRICGKKKSELRGIKSLNYGGIKIRITAEKSPNCDGKKVIIATEKKS